VILRFAFAATFVVLAGCLPQLDTELGAPAQPANPANSIGDPGDDGQDPGDDNADPGDDGNDSGDPDDEWADLPTPELRDNVVILDEDLCFEGWTPTSQGIDLTFSCPGIAGTLQPGQVVITGKTGGLLRELVWAERDGNVVHTVSTQATLADVISEGGFSEVLEFADERETFDVSGTELYSGSASGADIALTLTDGVIEITPKVELDAEWGWWGLERADVVFDASLGLDLELEATISDEASYSGSKELGSFSRPFGFMAGPVPVGGTLEVTVSATFSARAGGQIAATVGMEGSGDVHIEGMYDGGDYDFDHSKTWNFGPTGPDLNVTADFDVRVGVETDVRVMLYTVAGPNLTLEPYLRGHGAGECYDLDWSFHGGGSVGVGLNLDIYFWETNADFGPWSWETELGSGTVELPYPLGTDCDEEEGDDDDTPGDDDDTPGDDDDATFGDDDDTVADDDDAVGDDDDAVGDDDDAAGDDDDAAGDDDDAAGDDDDSAGDDDDSAAEEPTPVFGECSPFATLSCGQTVTDNTATNPAAATQINGYLVNVGLYSGPELVYEWTAGGEAEVEFSMPGARPTQVNHDIMILDGSSGSCMSSNAVTWGFNSLLFEPEAGKTYYVVIDGYDGDAGEYTLELDCNP
jgi:hypothetical protein